MSAAVQRDFIQQQGEIQRNTDFFTDRQLESGPSEVTVAILLTILMYALIQQGTEQFANHLGLNREVCFALCNPGFPFLHNCDNFCPVDGGLTEFSGYCSVTCGSGILVETRSCTNPAPKNGGKDCSGVLQRSSPCINIACPRFTTTTTTSTTSLPPPTTTAVTTTMTTTTTTMATTRTTTTTTTTVNSPST